MSAIIRQQLQLLLPTISTETGHGPDLEALPNEPSSLEVISVTAENLSRKVSRAQALLESWTTILVASAKEVRDEENALFAGFLIGGKSPGDIIAEGYDVQTKLDIKIDRIRNLAAQPPPPTGQTSTSFIRPTINLPALQLPDFDGHEANWPSFWAAFSHTIHDNPSLTGGQKLTYLVGRLRGSARTLVDGFTLTDHNYPIVVDLLKGRYGDDDKRADRLRSELFHLAKPTGHSVSLRNFSENVDRICRQLESLGNNLDNNSFLTVAIKEKLPTDIKAQLYDKEMEEGRAWTSKEWRERLARIVRLKEAIHAPWENPPAPAHSQAPKPLPPRYSEPVRRAFPVVGEIRKINGGRECSLCLRDGHKPSNCAIYQTVQQRINRLAEQGRCSLCAREGHHKDVCPSSARCFRCGGRHHLLVCPSPNNTPARGSNSAPLGFRMPAEKPKAPQANSLAPRPNGAGEHSNPQIASTIAERDSPTYFNELCPGELQRPTAYLMVKEISVFNNNGHPISVPVFFDPGSQPSFISSDLVPIISPDLLAVENMTVGGFSGNSAPETMRFPSPRFLIRLRRKDGGWEGVELNQTPKIVPPVEFLKEVCWHPAEPEKIGVAVKEPKILLGVREFWRFVVGKQEIFPGLFRIETVFGPVFGGEASQPSDSTNSVPITCSLSISGAIVSRKNPEELVKQLWSLESIGISDPLDVNDDSLAIAHFRDSVKFKEGRYEVGWPWRPGGRNRLADNFCLAFSRLSALSRRLLVNPEFREKYQATISDQLERGIIEPADRTGAAEHYIPHQAVVTPKKLRVVYDASAHEKGKPSLNELLFPGPNLVPELAGVLLRFRATAYPVLGDIEKAFLAVGLLEEDREVAKFLWLKDPSQPLTPGNLAIYRFKRIAFGVNSSPFLLASVLQHHLSSVEDSLNMARNFYVDNLLLCNESAEEAVAAVQTARRVMAMAGMRLREFVAPDPSVLSFLPPDEVLVGDVQKVLGIHWNLPEEKLIFELPAAENFPPTRRGILGTIASLFDPLGLCSPCLVKAKIFFQSLWDLGKGWDDPIGEEHEGKWAAIISDWNGPPLTFARQTPCSKATLQLHIFSDAGPNAFATAVYLRAERDGQSKVSLLFAKSRLRPKKFTNDGVTIPRLELLGLVTAVRDKNFITKNFDRPFEKIFFWVDSQIVLSWLASDASQTVFIENRLTEIRKEREAIFRYVRSGQNPADLGTRGASVSELAGLNFWYSGPDWLKDPEGVWPKEFRDIIPFTGEPTASETKHKLLVTAPVTEPIAEPEFLSPRRFHSWSKLLITTTFIFYFLSKICGRSNRFKEAFSFVISPEGTEPSSPEIRLRAKKWLIKREQAAMSLENGTFTDCDGLVRLKTRLANAHQPADFKNPAVLPRGSEVTRLLILSAHQSLTHAGVSYTLAKFLSEFWCVRARRLVKSVLGGCLICRKDKAIKFSLPPMPPLPTARTTPSPPFTFVGLDYLGPTLFKSPEGPKKAWVLLFTCLSCRAVHLEMVDSLSAVDFLAAFRRFVARRGTPRRVWSDNGTQLVLGRQLLRAYYDLPVDWKLIPPHSPWAGGVYERMVGLVKTAFRRSLGKRLATWGQLQTLTHEIEAILNSRPITFVSDDRDDPLPLRPVDFLSPHSKNFIIEPNEPDQPFQPSSTEKLAHLWYVTNESLRRFWQIWSQEYLLILRGRTKDTHAGPRVSVPGSPKVGDIVLIEQEGFPRNHWPLGRIISLLPPSKPRSAKVLLGNGKEWERSVNQVVPLEGSAEWADVSPPAGKEKEPIESMEGNEKKGDKIRSKAFRWADRPPLPPSPIKKPDAPRRYNWARLPPPVAVALVILSIINGINAGPQPLTCDEQGIWVFINPKAEGALVCCEGICSSRGHSTPYLLPLPLDVLASGFECHVTYSLRGEKISSRIECEPAEGCTLINCVFCWEILLNPHCSPFLLPMLLGTIIGGASVMFILGCCFLKNLFGPRMRFQFFGLYRRLFPGPQQQRRTEPSANWGRRPTVVGNESGDEDEMSFHFAEPISRNQSPTTSHPSGDRPRERSFRPQSPTGEVGKPRLLTRLGYALSPTLFGPLFVLGVISLVNAGLDVMPITANTEECFVNHGGTECHFDSVTSLTLLPVGQKVELVFHTPHAVPMGSLFVELQGLSLRCVQESLGWTRSHQINMSSILRCPGAGSCLGAFCSDLGVHQYVPELTDRFPGLNFCREASGFIRRGCLSPAYACLFYRIFAAPTSPFVYELVKCPAWQFQLNLELTFEFESAAYREELVLFPGISSFWPIGNLSLVFSPGGLPPLPLLGGLFLTNLTHAAFVQDWSSRLMCASKSAAEELNCSLPLDACSACHTHHEEAVVQCHCKLPFNVERAMGDPTRVLPNSFSQVPVSFSGGTIWSTVPYTPINLILKMGGTRLAVRHAPSMCTVTPGRLVGCHSCRTGGRFNYTCASSRGDSFASINCADGTMWVTHCSPKSQPNSVILSWSHPEVETRCKVDCLGGETHFVLKGTLIFLIVRESDYLPIGSKYGKRTNYTGGITFPQIKFALFQSMGSWPQATITVTVCLGWVILFLLAVRYCPISALLACCCPQTAAGMVVEGARARPGIRQTRNRHHPGPGNQARTM